MRKLRTLLLPLLAACFLLTACSPATKGSETTGISSEVSGTADAVTTSVSSDSTSETADTANLRIISTVPSATEILFALGCGSSIVGVDVSSTYPEQTADIEKVGDYNGFDVEKIISLYPTVVFVGYTIQDAQTEQLNNAGIRTVPVEARSFTDISSSIQTIGAEVGKTNEAEALVAGIEHAVSVAKVGASVYPDHPSVYYVMGIGEYGNWTSGKGSFINDMIEICGGECVTKDTGNAWIEYPVEDLLVADPDILLVSSNISLDDLKADSAYSALTAVKEGRVYSINPDIVERPGPRVIDAISQITTIICDWTAQ